MSSEPLKITDPHKVPVTFINMVGTSGCANGVANITLLTTRLTPTEIPQEPIPLDLIVSARLRLDLYCVQQLRDALNVILEANTKPAAK